MQHIYVIGSASMDLVVSSEIVPEQGETVLGEHFFKTPGGKGANQAVAAARLGDHVHMIGCVGNDTFGTQLKENFEQNGVQMDGIQVIDSVPTGTAHITLSQNDNRIIVVPSANYEVTPQRIQPFLERLKPKDIVLIQQEIPEETVKHVIAYCYQHEVISILNPAPYREIPQQMIEQATYLTPNETESAKMFDGAPIETALEKYPNQLIVTLGSAGAIYHNGDSLVKVPSFKRTVKDTTGAGDTFNGALAVGLQKGYTLTKAIEFANLAASHSVTGMGAQGGMPYLDDLKEEFEI